MIRKLRSPTRKPIVLRAVRPNAGLRARFHAELLKLVKEMHNSLDHWLRAAYNRNEPEIAAIAKDKSPAAVLQTVFNRLRARWQKRFDEAAPRLAKYFSQKIADRSDAQLRQILKDGGFSVPFKMTKPMNDVMQATINEQVGLIRSIAQQHLGAVEGLVMRSVSEGRDLYTLSKALRERYGVTARRAAFISLDQNNKSTAAFTKVRQLELGIEEAEWMHSHAGREPRPQHVKWGREKKRYKISEGMWQEPIYTKSGKVSTPGKYVWPGTEPHCRCFSRPVVAGFE
jgi:uncharacterized protein with gpF-like domain